MFDSAGGAIEITDLAPRFEHHGRIYCPMMIVRRVRRIAGHPRIRVRVRPAHNHGEAETERTYGSNHLRYIGDSLVLRLTTDVSITAILEENAFFLDDEVTLVLGPDETLQSPVDAIGKRFIHATLAYWREWRSEERRVGKEWRSRRLRQHGTRKE